MPTEPDLQGEPNEGFGITEKNFNFNNNDRSFSRPPSSKSTNEPTCRICYDIDSSPNNPLITPCKCSGTMRYIHIECLKSWIEGKKISRQSDNTISYCWKVLDCELCKEIFPSRITHTDHFGITKTM